MSWAGEQMLDSMLAETGYAIPESQLPELADRIQHLENLVATTQICDLEASLITNPSDISAWINTLIKGTASTPACTTALDADDPPPDLLLQDSSCSSSITKLDNNNNTNTTNANNSSSLSSGSSTTNNNSNNSNLSLPSMMHLVQDEQEQVEASGLRLIHLLLACASCVEDESGLHNGEAMVNEIRMLVLSMGDRAGAMGRVALYFAQGLERRMILRYSNTTPEQLLLADEDDPSFMEMLHLHFYHACPYLKFGHFTANQAMLEELRGERIVHIVDLDLGLGLQWPPLIHMLAIQPGGPPVIRFTAVVPPVHHLRFQAQHSGMRLAHLAKTCNVELRFNMVEELRSLQLQPGEPLAVNSMLQLHRHLHDPNKIASLLGDIRRLNPKIFTVMEQDASHNGDNFQGRFVEALHFYSSMFDSLDAGCKLVQAAQEESAMASEVYLGREIRNLVACEGQYRVERHERLQEWRHRLYSMGFRPRHLGSNAYNQAATLLTIFPGGGHNIQETAGCLTLGWHSRPLFAASAWRCS